VLVRQSQGKKHLQMRLLGGPQHLRLRGREGRRGHVRRTALPGGKLALVPGA